MKKMQQTLILLFILSIGFSCTTQNKETKKEGFSNCDSNLKSKEILQLAEADKDSLIQISILYANVNLYQNTIDKTFTIKDDNSKVRLKKIKRIQI